MSIREVTMFTYDCDRCGANADANTEYAAWSDKEGAMMSVREYGWHEIDSKFYCFDCTEWDEDTDEIKVKSP